MFYYGNYTFRIWWLITLKPLELKQNCMSHLKVLVCGIDAYSFQFHGCIFMLCYTHLNLALLLHKTVLVTFLLGSTLWFLIKFTEFYPVMGINIKEVLQTHFKQTSCSYVCPNLLNYWDYQTYYDRKQAKNDIRTAN